MPKVLLAGAHFWTALAKRLRVNDMDACACTCENFVKMRMRNMLPGTVRTTFRCLDDATSGDWQVIVQAEAADRATRTTGDRLLDLMASLQHADALGSPVNLYTHSLQTATRVLRAGEDDELVVVALFHDLGEALSDNHHGLVAAELLSPWISEPRTWLLIQHVDFQQFHFVNNPAARRRT